MSRIGKKPVQIPQGVSCSVARDRVDVKGPKGSLSTSLPDGIAVRQDGGTLVVERAREDKVHKARHGMVRSILHNSVAGVTSGWKRELEIVGIGYKANVEGTTVTFNLGFSHPKIYPIPDGIQIAIEKQTKLTVTGIDRQRVGQVAAEIRSLRPPEPYKGKGIKYSDEIIKKKVGKTGA